MLGRKGISPSPSLPFGSISIFSSILVLSFLMIHRSKRFPESVKSDCKDRRLKFSNSVSILVHRDTMRFLTHVVLNQWWKETRRFYNPIDSDCKETLGPFVLVSDCWIGMEEYHEVPFLGIQSLGRPKGFPTPDSHWKCHEVGGHSSTNYSLTA